MAVNVLAAPALSEAQAQWVRDVTPAAAVLLAGASGAGTGELALALGRRLCGEGGGLADLLVTLPGNKSGNIPVDAVRAVGGFLALAPVARERRVALILRADKMREAAFSALLKILEEPGEAGFHDKCILLWTPAVQQLPATIVSRCHVVHAPVFDAGDGGGVEEGLLAFCGGNAAAVGRYPEGWHARLAGHFSRGGGVEAGRAVGDLLCEFDGRVSWHAAAARVVHDGAHFNADCLDKPAAGEKNKDEEFAQRDVEAWFSELLHKSEAKDVGEGVEGLQKWVADGVRVAFGLAPVFFPSYAEELRGLAEGRGLKWLNFYRHLLGRRRLCGHPLVPDLFLREILYGYQRLCAR